MRLVALAAVDKRWGIGKDGQMPWHCPEDLKLFAQRSSASHGALLMGRKTWEALPVRPLPGRFHAVLSRGNLVVPGGFSAKSPQEALGRLRAMGVRTCFIVGGQQVYEWSMGIAHALYISEMTGIYECDTFFPHPEPWGYSCVRRVWHANPSGGFYDSLWVRKDGKTGIGKNN